MAKINSAEKVKGVCRNFPNFHRVIKAANREQHITKKFRASVVKSNWDNESTEQKKKRAFNR